MQCQISIGRYFYICVTIITLILRARISVKNLQRSSVLRKNRYVTSGVNIETRS